MNEIFCGDALENLKRMPDQNVQCIITSPPYFGLRDYGQKGQIGLEETPEQYVQKLVEVFREARRVLKNDGTLWLNLGDSYAGSGRGRDADGSHNEKNFDTSMQATNRGSVAGRLINNRSSFRRDKADVMPRKINGRSFSKNLIEKGVIGNGWVKPPKGLKHKDLIGIPWMVAFAMRTDGWYLRQDIIWQKPNPMPESVSDRCTKAHEYIFLLTKRSKYFYDADAIRTESKEYRVPAEPEDLVGRTKAQEGTGSYALNSGRGRAYYAEKYNPLGANKRSVWSVGTTPFKGAHFATFPEKLIEPMVLAGAPRGGGDIGSVHGIGHDRGRCQETRSEVYRCRTQPRVSRDRAKASLQHS